jgi:hypothetical protein
VQHELLHRQAAAHVLLQHRARLGRGLHRRVVEARGVAPGRLGLVHGRIGHAQQVVDLVSRPCRNTTMPMLGVLAWRCSPSW